jgi:hypothetical protein
VIGGGGGGPTRDVCLQNELAGWRAAAANRNLVPVRRLFEVGSRVVGAN